MPANPALTTLAEQSGWKQTGRYDEVLRLCDAFAQAYPAQVRSERFGTSPEGRPMVALVVSGDGALDPEASQKRGRPVVLIQAGIHAGEIDGKDAGFWLLRDLLEGQALPGALSRVTLVFVPVANVDGHERFGPNNRPNQVGPEQMGWRVSAQRYNLNRDYAKVDAPETAALLRLMTRWDPVLFLDLHVTDGAKFQHQVAVCMQPIEMRAPEGLRQVAREARDAVLGELSGQGHQPVSFYPDFINHDAPSSGIANSVSEPRFSDGYWPLRNRLAVLVETHSWKDYATRVKATRDTVLAYLRVATDKGGDWLAAARAADAEDKSPPSADVVLEYGTTDSSHPIEFEGYAYELQHSDVSNKDWIRYDDSQPQVWTVPFFEELQPTAVAQAPAGGYLVPAAHAGWVSEKLKLHGLSWQTLAQARPGVQVEVFRATSVQFGQGSYEGHVSLALQGGWARETHDLPAGSLYVPANQPGRRLLVHLLDPAGPDALVRWGFFNTAFEQKEYMEDYVAEEVARQMLEDPGIAQEFQRRLDEDQGFANDPGQRLDFFKRRHPSYDWALNLYPVYRLQAPLA